MKEVPDNFKNSRAYIRGCIATCYVNSFKLGPERDAAYHRTYMWKPQGPQQRVSFYAGRLDMAVHLSRRKRRG